MTTGLLDKARDLFAELRNLPDQRKHEMRHTNAMQRVHALGRPRAILIMCTGTVCHSFYAAVRLRTLLAGTPLAAVEVQTEGDVAAQHGAGPAHAVAAKRGILLPAASDAPTPPGAAPDVLLVMGAAQAIRSKGRWHVDPSRIFILGDLDPMAIRHRELAEPSRADAAMYEASYTRIDRCLERFVNGLLSMT